MICFSLSSESKSSSAWLFRDCTSILETLAPPLREYSKRILAGSIVVESDDAPRRTDLPALPDEVLDVCERRYVRCAVTMESWCPSFGFRRSDERPDRANILMRRAAAGAL